jgi:hypothetical protein
VAAWARGILGRQHHLDPRQVRRQRPTARTSLGCIVLAQLRIPLLCLRILFGDRLLAAVSRSAPDRCDPDQDLDPVGALASIHDDRSRERIFGQHLLRQRSEAMCAFTEIYRSRGKQDACASRNGNHARDAEARTARNTVVSNALSMPEATRTTAPASWISTILLLSGGLQPWQLALLQ